MMYNISWRDGKGKLLGRGTLEHSKNRAQYICDQWNEISIYKYKPMSASLAEQPQKHGSESLKEPHHE